MKHSSLFNGDAWILREFKPAQGPATPVVHLREPNPKPPWSPNLRDKKNDKIRATFPTVTANGNSPAVRAVIQMVAGEARLTLDDIRGRNRKMDVMAARQVAVWIARRFTKRSLAAIASEVGWRDHTTILSTLRRVEKNLIPECPKPSKDTPEAWAVVLLATHRERQRRRWKEYRARQPILKRARNTRRRARYQQLREGAS